MVSDSSQVELTGLAQDAAAVNALLSSAATSVDDPLFIAVFANEPTTFFGSEGNGDSMFGSSGADTFDVTNSTGFNYIRLGGSTAGTPDVVLGSANAFDFVDTIWFAYPTGITFDMVNEEMRVAGTATGNLADVYATVADADGFRGTDFDDIFIGTSGRGFFFITGRGDGGSDSLSGNGAEWFDISFQDLNGGNGLTITQSGQNGSVVVGAGLETSTFAGVTKVSGSQYADIFNGSDNSDERWQGFNGADTFNGGQDDFDEVTYENENDIGSLAYYATGVSQYGIFANQSGDIADIEDYLDGQALTDFLAGRGLPLTVGSNQVIDTFNAVDTLNNIEKIRGSVRSDVIVGGDDDSNFDGAGGDDWLFGNGGNDQLQGDNGNGQDGADHIFGGEGDDWMEGNGGDDTVDGGNGNDEVRGDDGDYTLLGGNGDDVLKGGRGADAMDGGNSDHDRINYNLETTWTGDSATHGVIVNLSANSIVVDDVILYGTHTTDLNVAGGTAIDAFAVQGDENLSTDTITNVERIEGTGYSDHIVGSDDRDNLNGNAGDDFIDGRGGDDELRSGSGDDEVRGGSGHDFIIGSSGTDEVDGESGYDSLTFHSNRGAPGGLDLYFFQVNPGDTGSGSVGTGTLEDDEWDNGDPGQLAVDTVFKGIERVIGSNGEDNFIAQVGYVATGEGDGGPNNARYISVTGGEGVDHFIDNTTPAANTATSGGAFRVDYDEEKYTHDGFGDNGDEWGDNGESGVLVNLVFGSVGTNFMGTGATVAGGTARDTFGSFDTFSSNASNQVEVRAFRLTNAQDFLTGGALSINVSGAGGDDFITGGGGDDDIGGDSGRDTLNGGLGSDYIKGGRGGDFVNGGISTNDFDTFSFMWDGGASGVEVYFSGSSASDLEQAGTSRDSYGDWDTFSNIERVEGTQWRDLFIGDAGQNWVEGNGGMDAFSGGAGVDTFSYENEANQPRGIFDLDYTGTPIPNYNTLTQGIVVNLQTAVDVDGNIIGRGTDTYGMTDVYENVENVKGSQLGDTIRGSQVSNRLDGRDGIDNLFGMAGDDDLRGDEGNDILDGGAGADSLNGGGGIDTATYQFATAAVVAVMQTFLGSPAKAGDAFGDTYDNMENLRGSNFNDTLIGNGFVNFIEGLIGNDTLHGRAGLDTLVGGLGDDTYVIDWTVENGVNDTINEFAGQGTDTVQFTGTANGQSYALALTASRQLENLTLLGGFNTNGIGNTLNNVFTGNTGINSFTGDLGNDTYNLQNVGDVATETSATGGLDLVNFTGTANAQTYTLVNGGFVENLTLLGSFAINGTGNARDNVVTGNALDNTLNGLAGLDTLIGGNGNDTYVINRVVDGATTDVVSEAGTVASAADVVQFTANAAGLSYSLTANVEILTILGTLNTNGVGNLLANTFNGNIGVNSFAGGDGNDTYNLQNVGDVANETNAAAAGGTDLVNFTGTAAGQTYVLGAASFVENLTLLGTFATNGTGNGRANVITGNGMGNVLNGAGGIDTLTGGAGNDFFAFNTPIGATNADVITDLNEAGDDFIQLENTGAGMFTALTTLGTLAATAYTENATGTATTAGHRIIYETDTGKLWYDSDGFPGPAAAIHFATLDINQAARYSNADFIVI